MVGCAVAAYRNASQAAVDLRVSEQVVREQGVQIQDGVSVEADPVGLVDKQLDGRLVVQDHLRFQRILALADLARLQQGVGIALQGAGVP